MRHASRQFTALAERAKWSRCSRAIAVQLLFCTGGMARPHRHVGQWISAATSQSMPAIYELLPHWLSCLLTGCFQRLIILTVIGRRTRSLARSRLSNVLSPINSRVFAFARGRTLDSSWAMQEQWNDCLQRFKGSSSRYAIDPFARIKCSISGRSLRARVNTRRASPRKSLRIRNIASWNPGPRAS